MKTAIQFGIQFELKYFACALKDQSLQTVLSCLSLMALEIFKFACAEFDKKFAGRSSELSAVALHKFTSLIR